MPTSPCLPRACPDAVALPHLVRTRMAPPFGHPTVMAFYPWVRHPPPRLHLALPSSLFLPLLYKDPTPTLFLCVDLKMTGKSTMVRICGRGRRDMTVGGTTTLVRAWRCHLVSFTCSHLSPHPHPSLHRPLRAPAMPCAATSGSWCSGHGFRR